MTTGIDLDHLRGWIGRQETTTEAVTPDLVRRFRATFDIGGPPVQPGEAAPRLIHWCLGQPAATTAALGPDGHPARGGFLPPVPLPRRMWAGGAVRFTGDLRVGQMMERLSRIADVTLREGRSGSLCFVTVEHLISAAGRVVATERQDIVYRAAAVPAAVPVGKPAPLKPAPAGRHLRPVDIGPALLFRYSALTFNGHRIHYDRPYATVVEGYPGLVVHGPLQATLLFNYAAGLDGRAPDRFSFRSLSPLFDDDPVRLHAAETEDGLTLWTAREGGPVAMTAEAGWD
ncbi:MaoC family dehydratase N-terminal domain-containing protein [Tistrella mobilis]|uniref:FAS1-like dehydratase domain-containing protein n=1 Tax=Tistrella mobilis TaxID=171437 RepID=UPI003558826A